DCREEFVEKRARVVRPRCGLRVILYRENRQFPVLQPFDRAVVQVEVRNLKVGRAGNPVGAALDGEPMVLRRNEHTPGRQVLYRMISAAVPVWEFRGPTAERDADELVAEAYPEERNVRVRDALDSAGSIGHRGRIPRTV